MIFYHDINPVLISVFGFDVRYYGLMYIIGLLLCYFLILKVVKDKKTKLTKNDVYDLIIYAGFGLLIGGRIGYFLFYDFGTLISNPLNLLYVWKGGMSFHGGLLGLVVAGLIYCRKYKVKFLEVADLVVIPVGVALFLGRIGNFINGELFGRVANDFWFCIDYTKSRFLENPPEGCRYPSQLVEAAKNLVIFGTLWSIRKKKLRHGSFLSIFLIMYGVLRFLIEFIRQPDPQLGFVLWNLTMGQILCFFMIVGGLGLLAYLYRDRISLERIKKIFSQKKGRKE